MDSAKMTRLIGKLPMQTKQKYTDEIVIPHLHTIINDYKVDLIWWNMGASSAPEFKYRMMKAIKNIPGTERLIFNDRMEDKLTGDFKNSGTKHT